MKSPGARALAAAAACMADRGAAAVVAQRGASMPRPLADAVELFMGKPSGDKERMNQAQDEGKLFGDTLCPCIGFDNIAGTTLVDFPADTSADSPDPVQALVGAPSPSAVSLRATSSAFSPAPGKTIEVVYPADLGAHCKPWDQGVHPLCKGKADDPAFCGQAWCYVDPCNCKFRDVPAKSEYVPEARYRGAPLFFSYESCGGKNSFSKAKTDVGSPRCRCVGLHNVPGTTEVLIDTTEWGGKKSVVTYPGDLGASCQAWDKNTHPLCKSDKPPSWCTARWCYVDPCDCDMLDIPKVSMYLPKAEHSGKHLYYNYDTCGSKDTFTEEYNKVACFNQRTQQGCEALLKPNGQPKCGWTGSHCLGNEMLTNPLCQKIAKKYGKRFHRVRSSATSSRPANLAAGLLVAAAAAHAA